MNYESKRNARNWDHYQIYSIWLVETSKKTWRANKGSKLKAAKRLHDCTVWATKSQINFCISFVIYYNWVFYIVEIFICPNYRSLLKYLHNLPWHQLVILLRHFLHRMMLHHVCWYHGVSMTHYNDLTRQHGSSMMGPTNMTKNNANFWLSEGSPISPDVRPGRRRAKNFIHFWA